MVYDNMNKTCGNSPFAENAPANVTLTEPMLELVSGGFPLPLVAYILVGRGHYDETAKGIIQSIGR